MDPVQQCAMVCCKGNQIRAMSRCAVCRNTFPEFPELDNKRISSCFLLAHSAGTIPLCQWLSWLCCPVLSLSALIKDADCAYYFSLISPARPSPRAHPGTLHRLPWVPSGGESHAGSAENPRECGLRSSSSGVQKYEPTRLECSKP